MSIKVFYAWQSDRSGKVCHYLIRDAAQAAIDALNPTLKADAEVEEAPPFPDMVLDHDTKGVPGIPKVADTIQKKITACDVFIADVTHVKDYVTTDGRPKMAQNGNVLIELGQAIVQKPPERILLVMNTAFGSFDGLPFDLHLHRKPILYNLPEGADRPTRDAAEADLTRKLIEALGVMLSDITAIEGAARARLDAAKVEQRREEADRIRQKFEEQVQMDLFHLFRADTPAMTLCMVPLVPPRTDVDLGGQEGEIRRSFTPFSGGSWNHEHDAEHFYMFREQNDEAGNRHSTSITAIRVDGCIFAADVMRRQAPGDATENAKHQLEWEGQELKVIRKLAEYLKLMRKLGIGGPVAVGLSLLHAERAYLVWDELGWIDHVKLNWDDTLSLKWAELPADLDGTNQQGIATAMKEVFNRIWRTAGARYDPYYQPDGTYRFDR